MPSDSRRLPAEWEPQAGVMLTWPHRFGDWAPQLEAVEPVFFQLARHIAAREKVLINCYESAQAARIKETLVREGVSPARLILPVLPSDDTWARDHGPLSVLSNDRPRLLNFRFNGWGDKYPSEADNAIVSRLAWLGVLNTRKIDAIDLVLEGGSIDSDGQGTLLTTASCLMHPARNPGHDRDALEQELSRLLGIERFLWLEHGALEGDDTDGHIDMLARFTCADTIAYQSCSEPDYPHYQALQAMRAQLMTFRTTADLPYRLVPLPWPQPRFAADGRRLPASYANFLVINGAVLMPAYDDPADRVAALQLQSCFPDREIIQVPCLPVIQQNGSLHCLTMQIAKGVELNTPAT